MVQPAINFVASKINECGFDVVFTKHDMGGVDIFLQTPLSKIIIKLSVTVADMNEEVAGNLTVKSIKKIKEIKKQMADEEEMQKKQEAKLKYSQLFDYKTKPRWDDSCLN